MDFGFGKKWPGGRSDANRDLFTSQNASTENSFASLSSIQKHLSRSDSGGTVIEGVPQGGWAVVPPAAGEAPAAGFAIAGGVHAGYVIGGTREASPGGAMSRDQWMKDSHSPHCYSCESQFKILNRRHHCRRCGRVFCGRCTQKTIPARLLRADGKSTDPPREDGDKVRVCDHCYKEALGLPQRDVLPPSSHQNLFEYTKAFNSLPGVKDNGLVPWYNKAYENSQAAGGPRNLFVRLDYEMAQLATHKREEDGEQDQEQSSPSRQHPGSPHGSGSRSDEDEDDEEDDYEQRSEAEESLQRAAFRKIERMEKDIENRERRSTTKAGKESIAERRRAGKLRARENQLQRRQERQARFHHGLHNVELRLDGEAGLASTRDTTANTSPDDSDRDLRVDRQDKSGDLAHSESGHSGTWGEEKKGQSQSESGKEQRGSRRTAYESETGGEDGEDTDSGLQSYYRLQGGDSNHGFGDADTSNSRLWVVPVPEVEEEDYEECIPISDDDEEEGEGLLPPNSPGLHEPGRNASTAGETRQALRAVVDGHFRALVEQMLKAEGLPTGDGSDSWVEVVGELALEAASLVKPDTSKGGCMDPGEYVKVKCIATGQRRDCMVVKGVVCRKNVAKKGMESQIERPQLLILGGALEYQRVNNQLSSMETLLKQQETHLKHVLGQIERKFPRTHEGKQASAAAPASNVLLVEQTVAGYAQEWLLEKKVSLVYNVKRNLLDRIVRCTGAQVASSAEMLNSLGHCRRFYTQRFMEEHGTAGQPGKKQCKTLMFFEGCPQPLGCTVLLKGASGDELKKVKRVVQFAVFAAYHLALETSFLADEGAVPPEYQLDSEMGRSPTDGGRSDLSNGGAAGANGRGSEGGPGIAANPAMSNSSETKLDGFFSSAMGAPFLLPLSSNALMIPGSVGDQQSAAFGGAGEIDLGPKGSPPVAAETPRLSKSPTRLAYLGGQGIPTERKPVVPLVQAANGVSEAGTTSAASSGLQEGAQASDGSCSSMATVLQGQVASNERSPGRIVLSDWNSPGKIAQLSAALWRRHPLNTARSMHAQKLAADSAKSAATSGAVPGQRLGSHGSGKGDRWPAKAWPEPGGSPKAFPSQAGSPKSGSPKSSITTRQNGEDGPKGGTTAGGKPEPAGQLQNARAQHVRHEYASPSEHQTILVSVSSRCLPKKMVCESPRLRRIKYYGDTDMPLGRFLLDFLFNREYRCKACDKTTEAHVRVYTHKEGSITISVRRLEQPLPGDKERIWLWHRCKRCVKVNGVAPATKRVVMSEAARKLSFGKFLELSFSNHAAASRVAACGHSLHRDCLRFYSSGDMIACFSYAPLKLHTVHLPSVQLEFKGPQQRRWLQEEYADVADKGELVFNKVLASLGEMGESLAIPGPLSGANGTQPDARRSLAMLDAILKSEKASFTEKLGMRPAAASAGAGAGAGAGTSPAGAAAGTDILVLNSLRRELALQAGEWEQRLAMLTRELVQSRKNAAAGMGATEDSLSKLLAEKTQKSGELDARSAGEGDVGVFQRSQSAGGVVELNASAESGKVLAGDRSGAGKEQGQAGNEGPAGERGPGSAESARDGATEGEQRERGEGGEQAGQERPPGDSVDSADSIVRSGSARTPLSSIFPQSSSPDGQGEESVAGPMPVPRALSLGHLPVWADLSQTLMLEWTGGKPQVGVQTVRVMESGQEVVTGTVSSPLPVPSGSGPMAEEGSKLAVPGSPLRGPFQEAPSTQEGPASGPGSGHLKSPSSLAASPSARPIGPASIAISSVISGQENGADVSVNGDRGQAVRQDVGTPAASAQGHQNTGFRVQESPSGGPAGQRNLSANGQTLESVQGKPPRKAELGLAGGSGRQSGAVPEPVSGEALGARGKIWASGLVQFPQLPSVPNGGRAREDGEASGDERRKDGGGAGPGKCGEERREDSGEERQSDTERGSSVRFIRPPSGPPSATPSATSTQPNSPTKGDDDWLSDRSRAGSQRVTAGSHRLPPLSGGSARLQPQDGPHIMLPVGMDSRVIPVYDDEPTSIIAYAVSTGDYQRAIGGEGRDREEDREVPACSDGEGADSSGGRDGVWVSTSDGAGGKGTEQSVKHEESQNPLLSSSQLHVKVQFPGTDETGKKKPGAQFTVTSYYAKQFDALRKKCCGGEVADLEFVRSLCRCKRWGAQGGKSAVYFAKTMDDRFVIKQVQRKEMVSFLDFARDYFKYLADSFSSGNPTCLAKIFGIYQVTVKGTTMNLMVMENLLCGRKISCIYDLKGSMRSRYNANATDPNAVLLDENLLETMPTAPIFVGKKSKQLLERAVWNDTKFLADMDVMDYSLLVGVVEESHELVLGIIDFIRPYTWDKQLETWVKASGILGGPKNTAPTIISPDSYKNRFRKAMKTYFVVVPDQWTPPPVPSSARITAGPQASATGAEEGSAREEQQKSDDK